MNHGTAVGQTRTHSRRLILRFAAFLCTLAALVILCPNLGRRRSSLRAIRNLRPRRHRARPCRMI